MKSQSELSKRSIRREKQKFQRRADRHISSGGIKHRNDHRGQTKPRR